MKFESQYPGIERYESMKTKLRKKREAQALKAVQEEERKKRDRLETLGMIILVPFAFMVMLFAYIIAWRIVPPSWW